MTNFSNLLRRSVAAGAAALVAGSSFAALAATPAAAAPVPIPIAASKASVANGTLTIALTGSNDVLDTATLSNGISDYVGFIERTKGLTAGPGCTAYSSGYVTCTLYTRIEVLAGPGDDQVQLAFVTSPARIDGGDGNDILLGGPRNDNVIGGLGNDTLNGDGSRRFPGSTVQGDLASIPGDDFGDDTIDGGGGNDRLVGTWGADTYIGGSGQDSMTYFVQYGSFTHRFDDLNITLDNTANDGAEGEGDNVRFDIEDVWGGAGDDIIRAMHTPPGVVLFHVQLFGAGGNDDLFGGNGNDQLVGGPGSDQLIGGDGTDRADGDWQFSVNEADADYCFAEYEQNCEA